MSVEQALAQFKETEGGESFRLQNSKLLKVELAGEEIQTKLGSMVAYQGDVRFEHAGSGGLSRMLKKAVTNEGTQLMKVSGTGEVFLADTAQEVQLLQLSGEKITVNGPHVLAFETGIDWDIKRVEGASGALSGGLYNMELSGTGHGRAGHRRAAGDDRDRRHGDVRRPAGRDHLVGGRLELGEDRRQPEDVHRQGLGRDDPARVLRARAGC